ncbi:MAG TPA: hypothetical protein VIQ30_24385 [Pseudonocardia sp.]
MHIELDEARERALTAISDIARALDACDDRVETRYLERLNAERDELILYLHATLGMPVLEVARRTGTPWTQVFDVIDRVRAARRKASPYSFPSLSLGDSMGEDTVTGRWRLGDMNPKPETATPPPAGTSPEDVLSDGYRADIEDVEEG